MIFILFGLAGLLVAGPIIFTGIYFELDIIKSIGTIIFTACWFVAAISWVAFMAGMLSGKYHNIQEQQWGDQLW